MKTISWIVVCIGAVTVAVFLSFHGLRAQSGRPTFTLTEQTRYYSPAGEQTTLETTLYGVRADGSWFREYTRQFNNPAGAPKTAMFRKFTDYAAGRRVSMFPALQAVTTTGAERVPPPVRSCIEGAPDGAIFGHPVNLVTKVTKMADRTVERKSWVAADLGCALLRLRTKVTMADGSGGGTNQMEVISISMGEPSPSYFVAPQGWKEMAPSEVKAGAASLNGVPLCPECQDSETRLDSLYHAARARAVTK